MSLQTIALRDLFQGQVLEISLNTPPANILSAAMISELRAVLAEERTQKQRKAIVLTGSGAHFCYGASVPEHRKEEVGAMLPAFHALIDDLLQHPVMTIARVTGRCLGGGFELALGCSLLFADNTAKFAVPEIQLGVFPPVAAVLLPHMGASSLSARMVLTGETIAAAELDRFGLLGLCTEAGALDEALNHWLETHVLAKSAASLRCALRAVRTPIQTHFRQYISKVEQLYLHELMATHDANEGIAAFMEKRSAIWTGE